MPTKINEHTEVKNRRKIDRQPKWYADKKVLRPAKQFQWSSADRAILYSMRVDKKMSITSIQRFFRKRDHLPLDSNNDRYSTTRLYNQIRMARASIEGKCHRCRKKLSKKDLARFEKNTRGGRSQDLKLCINCFEGSKEYKDQRREEALDKGICPDCMKRKVVKGKTKCKRCLSWTTRNRNLDKLCGKCGEKPLSKRSITFCDTCLEENRINSKEYRDGKSGKRA